MSCLVGRWPYFLSAAGAKLNDVAQAGAMPIVVLDHQADSTGNQSFSPRNSACHPEHAPNLAFTPTRLARARREGTAPLPLGRARSRSTSRLGEIHPSYALFGCSSRQSKVQTPPKTLSRTKRLSLIRRSRFFTPRQLYLRLNLLLRRRSVQNDRGCRDCRKVMKGVKTPGCGGAAAHTKRASPWARPHWEWGMA